MFRIGSTKREPFFAEGWRKIEDKSVNKVEKAELLIALSHFLGTGWAKGVYLVPRRVAGVGVNEGMTRRPFSWPVSGSQF